MEDGSMTLKEKLIYVRTELQMTQVELAKATGISNITIARWETQDMVPQPKSYGKFLAFCKANGITFDDKERD